MKVNITLAQTIELIEKGHGYAEHKHEWGDGTLGQIMLYHLKNAKNTLMCILSCTQEVNGKQTVIYSDEVLDIYRCQVQ